MQTTAEKNAAVLGREVLGIDIGGANIKLATAAGRCLSVPFPLWRESERLAEMLREMASQFGWETGQVGVTMTGELADCFETRAEGVRHIVEHSVAAFGSDTTRFYSVDGEWVPAATSSDDALCLAASNWHALAAWSALWIASQSVSGDQSTLLVDIGSTTVDIIPMSNGRVASRSCTDYDRLCAGELVYTGIERTPIPAILNTVDLEGQSVPLMAERFADSHDAYVFLGLVKEEPEQCDTADGRPKTRIHAGGRLARLVGEDRETVNDTTIRAIANQVVERQADNIAEAVRRVIKANGTDGEQLRILFSGHAEPIELQLLARLPVCESRTLREVLGVDLSRCAPAYAVAQLLNGRSTVEQAWPCNSVHRGESAS